MYNKAIELNPEDSRIDYNKLIALSNLSEMSDYIA
jgi:hypothetical protein